MLKKTLIIALTALSLGTSIAATTSPASAGGYGNSYDAPSYGYDRGEDPSYEDGNRYGHRRSGYDDRSRYGHRRYHDDGGYDNGGGYYSRGY